MSLELFNRGKASGCLSGWQVSQLSLGFVTGAAQSHARACEPCASRLDTEEKQRAAAAFERVPAVLLTRAGKSRWLARLERRHVIGFALVAVTLAVLAAGISWAGHKLMAPRAWVVAAVSRDGALLAHEVAPEHLGNLQAGDKLRLRVQGQDLRWARLEGRQGDRWETYFEGALPADGWLPAGMTVAPLLKTQLRLWACSESVPAGTLPPNACKQQQLDI